MFQTLYSELAESKLAVLKRPRPLFLFHTTGIGGGGGRTTDFYQFKRFVGDCLSLVCLPVDTRKGSFKLLQI